MIGFLIKSSVAIVISFGVSLVLPEARAVSTLA